MGLDGVELLMALEEAFGVEIKDDEAVKAVMPKLVIDLIYAKVRHADQKVCPSQRAFYVLRKACVRQLGANRKTFSPDTRIRSIIFPAREAIDWKTLQSVVDARRWPELDRPQWLQHVLRMLAVGAFLACITLYFCCSYSSLPVMAGFLGSAAAILLVWMAYRLTRRFKKRIPAKIQCVRDLVPFVATANVIEWTREQVAQLVKIVIQEQLGISDAAYREDAHFINDFGMG